VKYRVDEWVIFKPFPHDESKLLREIQDRAVILSYLPEDPFYDYKIIIEETGKIKKVREHQLFPEPRPTY